MQTVPTEVIGLDISKLTLDAHLHQANVHLQVENNAKGFATLLKWVKTTTGLRSLKGCLIVMEATGLYSYKLEKFLHAKKLSFCKRAPLEIRRSQGLTRSKSDKADARAIAKYGWQKRDELSPDRPPADYHSRLRDLLAARELLVTQCAAQKVFCSEHIAQEGSDFCPFITATFEQSVAFISTQIKKLEDQIRVLIASVKELAENYRLVSSVKGIGFVSAAYMLLYTANFSKFSDARRFSSWCGIAPFPYQSGSSINGRTKVSPLANRKMKSLMHQAAIVAVQHDKELGEYFRRKTSAGKNKMSVYNGVRAKLVARIFSVVKRKEAFMDTYAYAA